MPTKMTEAQLVKMETKDPNKYYRKVLEQYMEETDTPLRRERQMDQDDLLRICVRPELTDSIRIHIVCRAWFLIQKLMMEKGMVNLHVFDRSCECPNFAIRDQYIELLRWQYNSDMDAIYEGLKMYPKAMQWFKRVALKYENCPFEILAEAYPTLKAAKEVNSP